MNKLKAALLGIVLLAGCDTQLGTPKSTDNKDITGTYEQWLWSYGPDGTDNVYLKNKAVFSEKYFYEYEFSTVKYREYQYDSVNNKIRFKLFNNNKYWRGWQEIKWYSNDTFCIINWYCFHKVEEYSGPE